ncbi:MAG: M48 family metalloprotease [Planctomycetota bacterium]
MPPDPEFADTSPPLGWTATIAFAIVMTLLPLGLAYVLRRRGLRAIAKDETAWFDTWRSRRWIHALAWISCLALPWISEYEVLFHAFRVDVEWSALAWAGTVFAYLAPASVMHVAVWMIVYRVFREGGPFLWSHGQALVVAVWTQLANLAPIACVFGAIGALHEEGVETGIQWPVAWLLAGFLARRAATALSMNGLDVRMVSLGPGPLHDRIRALAEKAKIRLQNIFVYSSGGVREVNAFAVRGGTIVLSSSLLETVSDEEGEAVVAHELGHLKAKHYYKSLAIYIVLIASLVFLGILDDALLDIFSETGETVFVVLLAIFGILGLRLLVRNNEYQADRLAVELTGNPRAMITALVKLGRINRMPLTWGRLQEFFSTHPSTTLRARRLADDSEIPETEWQALLSPPESPPRVLPLDQDIVFSNTTRRRVIDFLWWSRALFVSLVGVLVVWQLDRLFPEASLFWIYPLTLASICLAEHVAAHLFSTRTTRPLETRIRRSLEKKGAEIPANAHFVGFSPGEAILVHDGFYDWDLGFLAWNGGQLQLLGERTRLSLRRADIESIELGAGAPSFRKFPRLFIRWRDATTGRCGALHLKAADARTLWSLSSDQRRLEAALRSWWNETSSEDVAAATDVPPELGSVEGMSPRAFLHPVTILLATAQAAPLTFVIAAISGLGFDWRGIYMLLACRAASDVLGFLPFFWGDRTDRQDGAKPASKAKREE